VRQPRKTGLAADAHFDETDFMLFNIDELQAAVKDFNIVDLFENSVSSRRNLRFRQVSELT
jgi:hypothetical protein